MSLLIRYGFLEDASKKRASCLSLTIQSIGNKYYRLLNRVQVHIDIWEPSSGAGERSWILRPHLLEIFFWKSWLQPWHNKNKTLENTWSAVHHRTFKSCNINTFLPAKPPKVPIALWRPSNNNILHRTIFWIVHFTTGEKNALIFFVFVSKALALLFESFLLFPLARRII